MINCEALNSTKSQFEVMIKGLRHGCYLSSLARQNYIWVYNMRTKIYLVSTLLSIKQSCSDLYDEESEKSYKELGLTVNTNKSTCLITGKKDIERKTF